MSSPVVIPSPASVQVNAPGPVGPPPQTSNPTGAPDQLSPQVTQNMPLSSTGAAQGAQQAVPVSPAGTSAAAKVLGGSYAPLSQLSPPNQKAAITGHGFHAIMQSLEGKRDNWVQTPNGPVNQPIQNTPGQFFRSILAGVLTGAAAGSGHGFQGAGYGAQAEDAILQRNKQQAQQKAQQQWQNQLKTNEENRAAAEAEQNRIRNQAEIAMWHATGVQDQQRLDWESQDRINKRNEANRAIIDTIQKNGGQDPSNLAPVMNIYDLRDKIIADRTLLHPPNDPLEKDAHRIFIDTVSGDTEKYDPDKNVWVDEVTGQPMDKTAKTNIRIFDVPKDVMNQRVSVPKSVMNKISGGVLFKGQTDGDVTLTLGQALGVGTTYRAQEGQARSDELATNTLNESRFHDMVTMTQDNVRDLETQMKGLTSGDPQIKVLQEQIDDSKAELKNEYYKIHPDSKKTADDLLKSPPPPAGQATPNSPSTLLLGKMQQDDHIQPGTPEAYQYITASGLKPEDQQAALRDSKTPIPWVQATVAADQLISQTPMSRETALRKVIQQAQSQGIVVAPRPNNGTVFSPYPDLSSSNVTAPPTK